MSPRAGANRLTFRSARSTNREVATKGKNNRNKPRGKIGYFYRRGISTRGSSRDVCLEPPTTAKIAKAGRS